MIAQDRRDLGVVSGRECLLEEAGRSVTRIAPSREVPHRVRVSVGLLTAAVAQRRQLGEDRHVDDVGQADGKRQHCEFEKLPDTELALQPQARVPQLRVGDLVSEYARELIFGVEVPNDRSGVNSHMRRRNMDSETSPSDQRGVAPEN